MGVQPKGEFEITYFGGPDNPAPNGGVNYSVPYTSLPPNDLAPGTINTHSINGFLCSSPWIASAPFNHLFNNGEYLIGIFEGNGASGVVLSATSITYTLLVTNVAVYTVNNPLTAGTQIIPGTLTAIHTWAGGELNTLYLFPGQAVSFIQSGGIVYLTGLMINGIWAYNTLSAPTFTQATNYVCGRFISELAGRLVVAECIFPGGGGTGTQELPTVAWSGVGVFGQAWDGNAAHDVWNPANQAFFNGNIGGFNQLEDVPDQITGMGLVGQSIIIVRKNGLTQQDPNSSFSNSGIQPFNWYHMWSSQQGVGGYAGTVSQFGQSLIFASSDNIYSLSMSGGIQPIGSKIIPRIVADRQAIQNQPGFYSFPSLTLFNTYWYFSSIYNLDGQIHYILFFNSYFGNQANPPTQQFTQCFAYDYNMSENSWHVWDFSEYFTSNAQLSGFVGISCPVIVQSPRILIVNTGAIDFSSSPRNYLFGAFNSYGTIASPSLSGTVLQFVPFDYNFGSNPINNWVQILYVPVSVPLTGVVMRGETLSLGHQITIRRLRIQADNAPFPTSASLQQQAVVSFQGPGNNSFVQAPIINMFGNFAPQQLSIKTYYGSAVLTDEMVQPSFASVFNSTNAWKTLCCFRIASISLIGIDATGTSQ